MKIFRNLVIFLLVCASPVDGRVPENLQGTTIFPTSIRIALPKKKPSKRPVSSTAGEEVKPAVFAAELEDEFCDLPTDALNLVNGAEFFMTVLQPLYWYANSVETVKNEEPDVAELSAQDEVKPSVQAGVDSEVLAPVPGLAQASRNASKYKIMFYENCMTKEPLEYEECNPLGVLVRTLFWQLPETTGLCDFRVTKKAFVIRGEGSKTNDMDATIDAWASVIARVFAMYQLQGSYPAVSVKVNKLFNQEREAVVKALYFLNPNFEKPTFGKLIWDCIEYSRENNLGQDFPLRILMGGVYSLAGHDRSLIARFYHSLLKNIKDKVPALRVAPEFKAIKFTEVGMDARSVLPSSDRVTGEISAIAEDPVAAETLKKELGAIRLIKYLSGLFNQISYQEVIINDDINFPDCVETTIRNIVLALLLQADGSFKIDAVRPDVQDFLRSFPLMSDQSKLAAHKEWAIIVSNLPSRGGYAREVRDYRYELIPSFINILSILNYIFDLGISDFDAVEISGEISSGVANKLFIESLLPKINLALRAKLKLDKDVITLSDALPLNADVRGTQIAFFVEMKLAILKVVVMVGRHAEVSSGRAGSAEWARAMGDFGYLRMAALNDIALGADAHFNIVHINKNLSLPKLQIGLPVSKHNALITRMALARAVDEFVKEPEQGFFWFDEFIKEKVGFAETIDAAKISMRSKNSRQLSGAIKIFKSLFDLGQGFDAAIEAAERGVRSEYSLTRAQAFVLFGELVKRGRGLEEAQVAVEIGMPKPSNRLHATNLQKKITDARARMVAEVITDVDVDGR
jgi:hypothetical protein